MIQSGDKIPSVPIKLVTADGTTDTTADVALGDGLVVFFGVPGAFTPTCDTSHLPGFVANGRKFADLGVKHVICGTVNDHHVTRAWGERSEAFGTVDFIADSARRTRRRHGPQQADGRSGQALLPLRHDHRQWYS